MNRVNEIPNSPASGGQDEDSRRPAEVDYRSFFEQAVEGMFQTTPEGRILQMNPALARMFGYDSPAEMMACITDLAQQHYVNAEDRTRFLRQIQERGGVQGFETQVYRKDQSVVWISVSARAAREADGRVRCIEGSMQDISARKRAESALAESEKRLRLTWECSLDGMRLTDGDGRMVMVNDAFCRLMQKPREALEGQGISAPYRPERGEEILRKHRQRFHDRSVPPHQETEVTLWNAQRLVLELSNSFVETPGETALLLSVFRDVTARKQAAVEARAQGIRLRMALEAAGMVTWEWDIASGSIRYSDNAPTIAAGETIGPYCSVSGLMQEVHPDDRERLARALDRTLSESAPFKCEYRARMLDGNYHWILGQGKIVIGKEGKMVCVLGISQEITDRKQAEEALQVQAQVLEKMAEGVALVAADYRLRLANPALDAMLAYAPGELLGQSVEFLSARTPDETARRKEEIVTSVRARGLWKGEMQLRRKDSSVVLAEARISSLTWGGQPHFVAVFQDVTEHKRLERQILEISDREQARIGQDLHDGLCQQLVSAAFDVNGLAQQLDQRSLPEAHLAERIAALLDESITESRRLVRGLYPVQLDAEGLASALEELAAATRARAGIACEVQSIARLNVTSHAAATHLYRIAQEAVNNVVKHSGARHVVIALTASGQDLRLEIRDDGRGIPEEPGTSTGMGMHIMAYRARSLGGAFTVANPPGGGAVVSCCVPRERL